MNIWRVQMAETAKWHLQFSYKMDIFLRLLCVVSVVLLLWWWIASFHCLQHEITTKHEHRRLKKIHMAFPYGFCIWTLNLFIIYKPSCVPNFMNLLHLLNTSSHWAIKKYYGSQWLPVSYISLNIFFVFSRLNQCIGLHFGLWIQISPLVHPCLLV